MGIVQQGAGAPAEADVKADAHIFVPARNEQECLGRCLQSLVAQQGIAFHLTVIDDGSTDQTATIAGSFKDVRVITAPEPQAGFSGKSNALIHGVRDAAQLAAGPERRANWLLFTDADTFHHPGSLAAAVAEAEERRVDMLSYSPEQEAASWSEHAILPLIFAALTQTYESERINDPKDPQVAANGQYILVRRRVYEQLGGHQAIAGKLLEDVELARLFKSAGHPIWFRYGAGMVRTRMYRNFRSLRDGWTKNLALLFAHPMRMAGLRLVEFILIAGLLLAGLLLTVREGMAAGFKPLALGLVLYLVFLYHVSRAHFRRRSNLAALFGLPLFSWLLVRSHLHLRVRGAVSWKGRIYGPDETPVAADSSIQEEISR